LLLLIVILLAAVSFCATSVWALFGTAIKTHLHNPRLNKIINITLSASLVYTAISLAGLI
jgi:cysteine/O-acetylserine efflux protein